MSQSQETRISRGWMMLPFGLGALALYLLQRQLKNTRTSDEGKTASEIDAQLRFDLKESPPLSDQIKAIDLGPLSD